jgi:hypothetical protein
LSCMQISHEEERERERKRERERERERVTHRFKYLTQPLDELTHAPYPTRPNQPQAPPPPPAC